MVIGGGFHTDAAPGVSRSNITHESAVEARVWQDIHNDVSKPRKNAILQKAVSVHSGRHKDRRTLRKGL